MRAVLNGHGMAEVLDVVELLTSELDTNAHRHANGPASLRLTALGEGRLRVGVWDILASGSVSTADRARDGGHAAPGGRVPLASMGAVGGRGLSLVQEFAESVSGRSGAGSSTGVRGSRCGSRWGRSGE
ncbi:ATP-binding protein [Streptomyces sp. NPDC006335]|uniref:ATP-binding protein n=1 Tax=Streptomyces sp. NPDC006335 TaxID=3156895 RepID=UPI0033BDFB6E